MLEKIVEVLADQLEELDQKNAAVYKENAAEYEEKLQELAEAAKKRIDESEGLDKLNEVRVAYLGKKGELTAILKHV